MELCIFCGNPADSKEDLFPRWILKRVNTRVPLYRQMGDAPPEITEDQEVRVPCACQKCNNTWMSDIENDLAKPCLMDMILSENPVALDSSCVASIAIFTFLKSVICDHAPENQKPFFSAATRYAFRRTLALPRIQLWIGCLSSDRHHAICRMKYGFWKPNPKVGISYRVYVFTWGVGRFFLQMLAFKSKSTRFRRLPIFNVIDQGPFFDQYAIPIWPGARNIVNWPPPKHLSGSLVDELTNRFTP